MLRGRNSYLLSIGWKDRFLVVKCSKKLTESKIEHEEEKYGMDRNPSANTVRV